MAEGSPSIEIPVEIAAEIIERLPLKSLARFKCASKLWSSLVRETISRRWREEMCRRLHRLDEIYRSLMSLHDTVKGLRCDADDLHEHGDRLRGNLDEIRSLAACNDDIDRYQEKGAAFDMLRDCVDRATNYCNWLLVLVDGLVEIDGKVKKIAAQGLNLRNIYNSFNLN